MVEAVHVTTPECRIVWGDPHRREPVIDDNTRQQKVGADGNPRFQTAFGIAIPKNQFGEVSAAMQSAAAQLYPSGIPHNFAWKYKDGDTDVDGKGRPLRDKEGQAGCYILTVSTEMPVRTVRYENGAWVQIEEGVKAGDYVKVGLALKAHAGQSPGLYINPSMVGFFRAGDPIYAGPDAGEMFGTPPTDTGGQPPQAMGAPGQPPAQQAAPAPAPQPAQAPQPQPGQAPMPGAPAPQYAPPAHDFVDNAAGAPAQPAQAPQPQPGQAPMPGMPGVPGQG